MCRVKDDSVYEMRVLVLVIENKFYLVVVVLLICTQMLHNSAVPSALYIIKDASVMPRQ